MRFRSRANTKNAEVTNKMKRRSMAGPKSIFCLISTMVYHANCPRPTTNIYIVAWMHAVALAHPHFFGGGISFFIHSCPKRMFLMKFSTWWQISIWCQMPYRSRLPNFSNFNIRGSCRATLHYSRAHCLFVEGCALVASYNQSCWKWQKKGERRDGCYWLMCAMYDVRELYGPNALFANIDRVTPIPESEFEEITKIKHKHRPLYIPVLSPNQCIINYLPMHKSCNYRHWLSKNY